MNRIGIYIRVSTEEQARVVEGSLVSQRSRLEEYVAGQNRREQGWGTIVDVYCDEAKSGKNMNRPEFRRLLEDVRLGRINLILATELSRLSRSIRDFCELWDLFKRHEARFITLREQFDTTSAAGEMMVFNLINFAQFERKQTAERISANCLSRAKRGLWNGGQVPLGYVRSEENKGVLLPGKDAEIIKTVFKTFLETGSLRQTCLRLTKLGIRTKRSVFTHSGLYHILTNQAYIGRREIGKKAGKIETVSASWTAIIDVESFNKVQAILEANKNRFKPDEWKTYPYPLTEKVVCGECGKLMGGKSAHGRIRKHYYYEHARKISKDGVTYLRRYRLGASGTTRKNATRVPKSSSY
jgi:site-specific DNA recombinase